MGFLNRLFNRNNSIKAERRANDQQVAPENPCVSGASASNLFSLLEKGSAMSLSPVFCAINIISNSCAMLPWFPCDKEGNALSDSHYLNHLFDNSRISRFLSMKGAIKDVLVHGNGYMYIERNKDTGKPEKLRYLPADSVSVFKNEITDELYYLSDKIKKGYINEYDIVHFKMHSKDGLIGVGILTYANKTIDLAKNTESATANYMASGGAVTGILTPNQTNPNVPTTQKQIDNIRASWENARAKQGTSTIILPADMKFTQLSANAKDAAYLDTRLYNLQEEARWFGISPILLGDLSHSQYGNLESSQREFVTHTLAPYITMMEDELNHKLVMPSKVGREFIDLDETAILATDKINQANYLRTLQQAGIITINEARAEIGYAPVEGGDELVIPFTDISQNTISNQNKISGEEEQEQPQDEQKIEEQNDGKQQD